METESHCERSFCLKNVPATCKYVFRSNFITNCPIGQCLGNYGMLCSFLRDQAAVGEVRGELSQRSREGPARCARGSSGAGVLLREGPGACDWALGPRQTLLPGRGQSAGWPCGWGVALAVRRPQDSTWHLDCGGLICSHPPAGPLPRNPGIVASRGAGRGGGSTIHGEFGSTQAPW